jgi:hypothetical protein
MNNKKNATPLISKKNILINALKNKIIPYSAKNKRTKPADPYSILNPEISSLSPSLKSNGARFVSAIHLNQKTKKRKK